MVKVSPLHTTHLSHPKFYPSMRLDSMVFVLPVFCLSIIEFNFILFCEFNYWVQLNCYTIFFVFLFTQFVKGILLNYFSEFQASKKYRSMLLIIIGCTCTCTCTWAHAWDGGGDKWPEWWCLFCFICYFHFSLTIMILGKKGFGKPKETTTVGQILLLYPWGH